MLVDWSSATVYTRKAKRYMDKRWKKGMLDGIGVDLRNLRWKYFREAGWITDEEISHHRVIDEENAALGKEESWEDEEESENDNVDGS